MVISENPANWPFRKIFEKRRRSVITNPCRAGHPKTTWQSKAARSNGLRNWDVRNEQKVLKTTTGGRVTKSDTILRCDSPNCCFFSQKYVLRLLPFCLENLAIHDRHTSVSRWGHFLDHFFFACFFFFFSKIYAEGKPYI